MSADLDHQNRLIVDCLRAALDDVVAVYRFGSTVHGAATSESDTDIAVLSSQAIPAATWFELQDDLSARLGGAVDLADLAAASPVLAIQIITRGQLLYDGDSAMRGRFEDDSFAAYARLNEERRGILERVALEGTIYGR